MQAEQKKERFKRVCTLLSHDYFLKLCEIKCSIQALRELEKSYNYISLAEYVGEGMIICMYLVNCEQFLCVYYRGLFFIPKQAGYST